MFSFIEQYIEKIDESPTISDKNDINCDTSSSNIISQFKLPISYLT
jgi:hypothetical protein